jgi:murein hydrolase activator
MSTARSHARLVVWLVVLALVPGSVPAQPASSELAKSEPAKKGPAKKGSAATKESPRTEPAKKEDPLQAEQRRLKETQKQLKQEQEKAAEARKRESSVLAEIEDVERRLADKQREVRQLDQRIRKTQAEIQALHAEIGVLEHQRTGQEDALGRHLRTIYRIHAQGGALPLILSQDDPVARAVTVRQLSRLAALDARMIREYRLTSDRLGDRRAREESRQEELATLRAQATREQVEVDREAARRRVLLAKVRDERTYHERMVGELSEAARRLEAFIRDLQARQRRLAKPLPKGGIETPGTGFGSLRGRLPWPTEGRIVTTFGAQVHPRFGTRTFRNGVDIEAGDGTDVLAVYPGHVVYTGWFKGYGNLIILDHGNDYYTLYAHVGEMLVHEGDEVKLGHRIGTVGDTGSLAGTRLYFEVRYQGKPLDPQEWLRQRG